MDVSRKLDYIFHLACPASPAQYSRMPIETLRAGSIGTMNLLELAIQNDCRFILASTSEVYGDPEVHPQPEWYMGNVDPIGPRSVYDEAKRFAEATIAAGQRSGLDASIVRIFNTYGPRMAPDDGRVVPTFICQALAHRPITVAGTGLQTRSLCYVSDTVRGLLASAMRNGISPVNIGNPYEITMLDLAGRVRELARSPSPIVHVQGTQGDPLRRKPNIELAEIGLNWSPRVNLTDGLCATIAYMTTRERIG
jgi:dTDP-glucose 4,6-dehydratase